MNIYYVAAIWLGMALLASVISIRIAAPAALVEILVGALAGNIPGIQQHVTQTGVVTFLASAGSLVLTFLAGAGVRYIRVHDTRRTCASLLVALDVHLRVAMQILRHSQIAMTMKIYSEAPSAKTRSALKRLGR